MVNAALLLADRLTEWTAPPNVQVSTHRGSSRDSRQPEFWAPFREAVRWLTEVEAALDTTDANGEDTSHYRESVPAWYRAVFSFDHAWTDTGAKARPAADRRDIALLKALGHTLETAGYVHVVDEEHLVAVREAIAQARLRVESSGLPVDLRRYLLGLIAETERCLSEVAAFGYTRLRDLVHQLGGAMHAVADRIEDEPTKTRWRESSTRLLGKGSFSVWVAVLSHLAIRLIGG